MRKFWRFLAAAFRGTAGWCGTLLLWTSWLALTLLLVFQGIVAGRREFAVPQWAIDELTHRLEDAGVGVKLGAAIFDPSGNVLVQDVTVALPTFEDPIVAVPAVYLRVDPWLLLVGRLEVVTARVSGATCFVPAMLSPSGKSEAVVSDLDLALHTRHEAIVVDSLTARVAGVAVVAHGEIPLPRPARRAAARGGAAAAFAQNYAGLARRVGLAAAELPAFENPRLQVEVRPTPARAAEVRADFFAEAAHLATPLALAAEDLAVALRGTVLSVDPAPAEATVTARELHGGPGIAATRLQARVAGRLEPNFSFLPGLARVTAESLGAAGVTLTTPTLEVVPPFRSELHFHLLGGVFGQPLAVAGTVDPGRKAAQVDFRTAVAPGWLAVGAEKLHRDVRRFLDFTTPIRTEGTLVLAPGWAFQHLHGRLVTGELLASHVVITEGVAEIFVDPRRIYSPEAYARIGENSARGTYEQDVATNDYRFLLQGELRPLAIAGWFTAWWKDLFTDIAFPGEVPVASVDLRSRWGSGLDSSNFIAVDSPHAAIRRVPFARLRTSLFIRPGNLEVLWVDARQPAAGITGRFTYRTDLNNGEWTALALDAASTFSLGDIAQLLGPDGNDWLKPFQTDQPPAVQVRGMLTRDSERDTHPDLVVHTAARGTFRLYDFPLENVTFDATLHNDDIRLDGISAQFAQGQGSGHAHLWGTGTERRLGFDYEIRDANLAQAVNGFEDYLARLRQRERSGPNQFFQERAQVRTSVAISAEGRLADLYSFHGNGHATIGGMELGEVHLLGGLSQLLRFTTLRFTDARTNFRIDGENLAFPDVIVTGANSAIRGMGRYGLKDGQLDFAARVFPFQESGFILQKFLAVALSPLSNTFEVKLSGTLDKPVWNLAVGTGSLLRDLPAPPPAGTDPFRVAPTP